MTSSSAVGKLSLQNAVLSIEQLKESPSRKDGISEELERDLRALGCELIQSAGILLRLPQVAMATAQVLFQRFYYMESLKLVALRDVAMGAIFLASKVEETPRKVNDIINVFAWLIERYRDIPHRVERYAGLQFNEFKDGLISGEMHILCKLGFNVQVQQPHGFMINYLQSLDLADNKELAQKAWNYMNDGLRTNIYMCYQPSTIACAVLYLAARTCSVKLPANPPWWELFDSEIEDLQNIAGHLLKLYRKSVRKGLPLTVSELESYLAGTFLLTTRPELPSPAKGGDDPIRDPSLVQTDIEVKSEDNPTSRESSVEAQSTQDSSHRDTETGEGQFRSSREHIGRDETKPRRFTERRNGNRDDSRSPRRDGRRPSRSRSRDRSSGRRNRRDDRRPSRSRSRDRSRSSRDRRGGRWRSRSGSRNRSRGGRDVYRPSR